MKRIDWKNGLVFLLLISLSLGSVFAAGQQDEGSDGAVEIEWFHWFSSGLGEDFLTAYDNIIQAYEEESGNKVKQVVVPFGKMRETIVSNHAVGITSDVVGLNMPWTTEFIELGALEPLDDYLANETRINPADLVQAPMGKIQGKTWMVPYTAMPFVLFYNKDLMAEAGLDPNAPPKDWDQLLDYCKKITNHEKNIYGTELSFSTQPPSNGPIIDMYPLLYTAGGRTMANGKANLTSPAVVETLDFLNSLVKADVISPGSLTRGQSMEIDNFATGRIGFMIQPSAHTSSLIARNPDLNFGVARVPVKKEAAFRVHGWELGIASGSQHKDAAWDFISYLLTPEVQAVAASTSGQMPGNTGFEYQTDDENVKISAMILKNDLSVEELRETPKAVPSWAILTESIQKMIQGEYTAQQTAEEAQAGWTSLFNS